MPALPSVPFTNNLDYQSRELADISSLASMTGTASQFQFHLSAAMNTGLTETQMKDFISVIKDKVGKKEEDNANEVLSKVLSSKAKQGGTAFKQVLYKPDYDILMRKPPLKS